VVPFELRMYCRCFWTLKELLSCFKSQTMIVFEVVPLMTPLPCRFTIPLTKDLAGPVLVFTLGSPPSTHAVLCVLICEAIYSNSWMPCGILCERPASARKAAWRSQADSVQCQKRTYHVGVTRCINCQSRRR